MSKSIVRTAALAALAASALVPMTAGAASASASDYPSRPVRLIGPFAPGAGTVRIGPFVDAHAAEAARCEAGARYHSGRVPVLSVEGAGAAPVRRPGDARGRGRR